MDKIWYRNSSRSEVIGRCGGDEKTDDHAELTKVKRLIILKNKLMQGLFLYMQNHNFLYKNIV